jgi:hypothetical protein
MTTCAGGGTLFIEHYSKHNDLSVTVITADGRRILEKEGYAPQINNVCGGDDTDFELCATCGKLHGFTPVTEQDLVNLFDEYEISRLD